MEKPLRIGEFMHRDPATIDAWAPLGEAEALMEQEGVRHLPVLEGGRLVGVVSERDIAVGFASGCRGEDRVEKVMSLFPFHVTPETAFSEALEIMAANRLGCVVIKDGGDQVVGIFTATDGIRILANLVSPRGRAKIAS